MASPTPEGLQVLASINHRFNSSSTATGERNTPLTGFFDQRITREAAELILDWLLDRMIKNWRKYGRPITSSEYTGIYEGKDSQYGFDFDDPLNIAVPNQMESSLTVLHYDPVVDKIPFLMDRPDTIPGFSTWLPLMKDILLRSFITYRTILNARHTLAPVVEFTQTPFSHQIGAVARLRVRILSIISPRLPRCHVRLGWNESWREIQIGVVKILGNEDIQIVAFSFDFNIEESAKLKKTCTRIRRVGDGRELDPDIFQVWNRERHYGSSFPSVSEVRENLARQAQPVYDYSDSSEFASDTDSDTSDSDTSDSDADDNNAHDNNADDSNADDSDSVADKMVWGYRPLDFSDVEGEGPFDVNTWHKFNYSDLRELVFSWGVRGALLMPAFQQVHLRQLCRRPRMAGRRFVPYGSYKTALEGSHLHCVLQRGFASYEPPDAAEPEFQSQLFLPVVPDPMIPNPNRPESTIPTSMFSPRSEASEPESESQLFRLEVPNPRNPNPSRSESTISSSMFSPRSEASDRE